MRLIAGPGAASAAHTTTMITSDLHRPRRGVFPYQANRADPKRGLGSGLAKEWQRRIVGAGPELVVAGISSIHVRAPLLGANA